MQLIWDMNTLVQVIKTSFLQLLTSSYHLKRMRIQFCLRSSLRLRMKVTP